MPRTIPITDGAGFIGSHLADELIARGHRVGVLDGIEAVSHVAARVGAGRALVLTSTPEPEPPALAALDTRSKYDRERRYLVVGAAYRIPIAALRTCDVHGPRQDISNPYMGELAIFAARVAVERPVVTP